MATGILGGALGGMLTLIFPSSLFLPLIPGACVSALTVVVAHEFIYDTHNTSNVEIRDVMDAPKEFHRCSLFNIAVGAIIDNVGSLGVVPIGISPVLYEVFYLNFAMDGLDPVMNLNQVRI